MNIFKLCYNNEQEGIEDLKSKCILVETKGIDEKITLTYGNGVQAVVTIGKIMLTPPVMDGMEVVTEPIYADGYHYDVMSDNTYDFGSNLVEPKNPKHAFAGYVTTDEFPYEPAIPTEVQ
jgi:hypothetical protein